MWWIAWGLAAEPPTLASLEAACDRGDLPSCTQAAIRLLGTPGRPGDLAKATARFEPACKGGDIAACRGLGVLLLDGQPPADDRVRGATLLEDACINHRDGGSCMRLGDLSEALVLPYDALRYWAEACSYGFDAGCTRASDGPPAAPPATPPPPAPPAAPKSR